jgi:hypothetical protein
MGLFGRFAALLGRLLQSTVDDHKVRIQVYMDDPLVAVLGGASYRRRVIAMIATTLAALGVKVAWKKCQRGRAIDWIGISFTAMWAQKVVRLGLQQKMISEITASTSRILGRGVASVRDVRSLAGKISWCAGVLTHLRWTAAVLYAVLASRDRDVASGTEESRRQRRQDQRRKEHLIPVKRFRLALVYVGALFEQVPRTGPVRRTVHLKPLEPQWMLIVDASPWGLGAVLVDVTTLMVKEALESKLTSDDETLFDIKIGEASAQGIVETLAVWMALMH